MHFVIGKQVDRTLNKQNYFTLHEDGSLLYSDKSGSYSVFLGDNWRYELLVDSGTGKCVGYSSLLYQMPVVLKSIFLPTAEKRELYFVESEDSPLEEYSGCSYKPFTDVVYFDKEKALLCIGEVGAGGNHIEFADNIIATVENSVLKCLYLKLENISSSDILKFTYQFNEKASHMSKKAESITNRILTFFRNLKEK